MACLFDPEASQAAIQRDLRTGELQGQERQRGECNIITGLIITICSSICPSLWLQSQERDRQRRWNVAVFHLIAMTSPALVSCPLKKWRADLPRPTKCSSTWRMRYIYASQYPWTTVVGILDRIEIDNAGPPLQSLRYRQFQREEWRIYRDQKENKIEELRYILYILIDCSSNRVRFSGFGLEAVVPSATYGSSLPLLFSLIFITITLKAPALIRSILSSFDVSPKLAPCAVEEM